MALELELNQKCKKRIIKTFDYYNKSNLYKNALFVFYKESTFNSYKKVLEANFTSDDQEKIILLLEPKLSLNASDIRHSNTFYKGNWLEFVDLSNDEEIPIHIQRYSNAALTEGRSF